MAKTLTQLQSTLASRLRENSAPSSTGSEYSRRTDYFNEAYRSVIRKHYWWFTEATASLDSVADQESYGTADGFPTDIRNSMILELRYNGTLYTPITQTDAFSNYTSTYTNYSQSYFIFNKKLYPVPAFPDSGTDYITLKYYSIPSELSTGSDTIVIPDEYSDVLVAFAFARVSQTRGKRGSAADGFNEYEDIMKMMSSEQNNYMFALKSNESNDGLHALYE